MRGSGFSSVLALSVLASLCACDFDVEAPSMQFAAAPVRLGNGIGRSESRHPARFTHIEASGSIDVSVHVGEPVSVVVYADSNLLDAVVTEVDGDTLHVRVEPGTVRFLTVPEVRVFVPLLDAIDMRGSGDLTLDGLDTQGSFSVQASGSGDLVLHGRARRISLASRGSGMIDARHLIAREVDVASSGSGSVRVHATARITGRALGSGDVWILGDPTERSVAVLGSGRVRTSVAQRAANP